jgi:hypothetical protein
VGERKVTITAYSIIFTAEWQHHKAGDVWLAYHSRESAESALEGYRSRKMPVTIVVCRGEWTPGEVAA